MLNSLFIQGALYEKTGNMTNSGPAGNTNMILRTTKIFNIDMQKK